MTEPFGPFGLLAALALALVARVVARRAIVRALAERRLSRTRSWDLLAGITWLPLLVWFLAASAAAGRLDTLLLAISLGIYLVFTILFARLAEPLLARLPESDRQRR